MIAMKIIDRYLIKQISTTWLMVTSVLLLITVGYAFADTVSDVATGRVPVDMLFVQLGLSSIESLSVLGPLSVYISILLSIARLYRDNEMVVLAACGFGLKQTYRPVMYLVIPISMMLLLISMWISPWADRTAKELAEQALRNVSTVGLQAGQFHEFAANNSVIYVESQAENGRFNNAFIHIERNQRKDVVTAKQGFEYQIDGHRYLVLQDGFRSEGVPGQADFRMMSFKRNDLRLPSPPEKKRELKYSSWTISELLAAQNHNTDAELQWRISTALAVIVLSLLAVPLARTNPRQGFYSNLIIGVLIYVIYANLLAIARNWIDEEKITAMVGMWWVHLIPIAMAYWMMGASNRKMFKRSPKVTS